MVILDSGFVDEFKRLFPKAFELYSSKFIKIESKGLFNITQDNEFNFPQFFLEHKIGLGRKYTYYNSGSDYGITLTPEFFVTHLDQDVAAFLLHKSYLSQLDLQEERQKEIETPQ